MDLELCWSGAACGRFDAAGVQPELFGACDVPVRTSLPGPWRLVGTSQRRSRTSQVQAHHQLLNPIGQGDAFPGIPQPARMASLSTAMRSTQKVAQNVLQRRSVSDITITRTGKPILRVNGGRYDSQLTFTLSILTSLPIDHLSEVVKSIHQSRRSSHSGHRTYGDSIWRNWRVGALHRQQARSAQRYVA